MCFKLKQFIPKEQDTFFIQTKHNHQNVEEVNITGSVIAFWCSRIRCWVFFV